MSAAPQSEDRWSRASSGEQAAIESLLAEQAPAIERFMLRHAGALLRERESASDLAQSVCREVLARLRDGRIRFQGEAEFRQWLYRAAVLKMMNRQRYWQAERRDGGRLAAPELLGSGVSGAAEVFVESASPSADAALLEDVERFARALAGLPQDFSEVITLYHLEGLSHEEIARRKGITQAHSRVLLARALSRLGKLSGSGPA
jgi:RNA polymerase sigma-70 factor (ECF subfamily)